MTCKRLSPKKPRGAKTRDSAPRAAAGCLRRARPLSRAVETRLRVRKRTKNDFRDRPAASLVRWPKAGSDVGARSISLHHLFVSKRRKLCADSCSSSTSHSQAPESGDDFCGMTTWVAGTTPAVTMEAAPHFWQAKKTISRFPIFSNNNPIPAPARPSTRPFAFGAVGWRGSPALLLNVPRHTS